jgi:hypothetical protein
VLALGALLAAPTAATTLAVARRAAQATVVVRRSIDQMVAAADLVVVADARAHTALWSEGRIYTDVELVVATPVRGSVRAGDTIVVRTPGGRVGDTGQLLAGAPELVTGQRYVLFLRRSRTAGMFETVGLSQGALPVRGTGDAAVVRPADTAGLELVGGATSGAITVPAEGVPLASLLREIAAWRR